MQTTMKQIDAALEAIPSLSESSVEKAKRRGQNKNY
jgi:hypothetical protein